mmetsp:Transcript_71024/g.141076  ORF Transcript_71024/g.141076 Transcript_71024/m.141076 type:complete len:260 (+) Transcript_71024:935-1714(+)
MPLRSWAGFKEGPSGRTHRTSTSELPSAWLAPIAGAAAASGGPAPLNSSLNNFTIPPVPSPGEVDFTSRTRPRSSANTKSISLWKSRRSSSTTPEKASRRPSTFFSTCSSELRRTSEQTSRAEAREASRRRASSSVRFARTDSLRSWPSPPIPDSSSLLALTARPAPLGEPTPGPAAVVTAGCCGLRASIAGDAARLSAAAVSHKMDAPVLLPLRRSSEASVDEALEVLPQGPTELTFASALPLLLPPENTGDDWAEAL